jgi:hypothetical protein
MTRNPRITLLIISNLHEFFLKWTTRMGKLWQRKVELMFVVLSMFIATGSWAARHDIDANFGFYDGAVEADTDHEDSGTDPSEQGLKQKWYRLQGAGYRHIEGTDPSEQGLKR